MIVGSGYPRPPNRTWRSPLIRLSAGESPLTASPNILPLPHHGGLQGIPEARSERLLYHTFWLNSTLVVTGLTIVVRPAALAEIITLHSQLPLISSLYHIMGVYRRSQRLARKGCYTKHYYLTTKKEKTIVVTRLTIVVRPAALA